MAEYPQSIKIYANITAGWTDITADVYAPDKITGYWGMRDNRELTRVADVGRMSFTLNNDAGLYAPNLGTALSGWGKGTQIKLVIRYRDRDHIKFFGTVDSLRITGGALGVRRVYVTVKDWMDYAAKYPLVNPGYQTNKRADEALTTIIAGMPIQPQDTTFGTGVETFPTVFDAVTTKTRAQSEFNKLALSEMGYIYIRKDFTSGENVTFEPRTQRKGTDSPTTYLVPAANSGFLLKEDGDYLLTESGDKIIIENADSLTLDVDNNMQDVGVEYGNNIINRMSVLAYPKKVDTSNSVLFSIGFPLEIEAGQTIEFRGSYFDPSGGATVNADTDNMEPPTITTDYLMNDASDGSGTDRSASLVISAVYGVEGVTYTLTNEHSEACFITKLQARGFGIYTYAVIESISQNQESIDAYGYQSETLHQMYQQNTASGKMESSRILDVERLPRTVLNTVALNANKSADFLYGFLVYDAGDLVSISEDVSGIDSNYYIQQVSFSIDAALEGSGVIDYSWVLKEQRSISTNVFSPIAIEFVNEAFNPRVNFGMLKHLDGLSLITISFWSKLSDTGFILNAGGGASGASKWNIQGDTLGRVTFVRNPTGSTWRITTGFASWDTTYHHVLMTLDNSLYSNLPLMYADGVSKTVTEPFGSSVPGSTNMGGSIRFGSVYSSAANPFLSGFSGAIKDFRIYNRILSASDALGITNEGAYGTGYLNSLLFQGFVVKNQDLSYYTDHVMVSTDRIIENVYANTGFAEWNSSYSAPTTRLP